MNAKEQAKIDFIDRITRLYEEREELRGRLYDLIMRSKMVWIEDLSQKRE